MLSDGRPYVIFMKFGPVPNGTFIQLRVSCSLAKSTRTGACEGGTEGRVKNIGIAGDLQREEVAVAGDLAEFTPAEFFKEAGTVIAVCLGLGLLMQILLQ